MLFDVLRWDAEAVRWEVVRDFVAAPATGLAVVAADGRAGRWRVASTCGSLVLGLRLTARAGHLLAGCWLPLGEAATLAVAQLGEGEYELEQMGGPGGPRVVLTVGPGAAAGWASQLRLNAAGSGPAYLKAMKESR